MLTAAQAGKLLGLSARTMYDLAKAGKVKKSGRGFDRDEVLAYKAACRVEPAMGPPKPKGLRPAGPQPWDDPDSAVAKYFRPRRKPQP